MLPNLGPMEMMIVMGLAVLLFGKRLPEVGRSLGRGIVEFKKGLNGAASELDDSSSGTISSYSANNGPPRRYDNKPRGDSLYNDSVGSQVRARPERYQPRRPSRPQRTHRPHRRNATQATDGDDE